MAALFLCQIVLPSISVANLSAPPARAPQISLSCLKSAATEKAAASSQNFGRIRIRHSANGSQFYNSITGEPFVPRGNNYIRLALLKDPWGGHNFGHSLFDAQHYDPDCNSQALSAMKAMGYNVVRVFVSEISSGNPLGPGLNPDYMRNLADFLVMAKRHGIHVIVVFWQLPRQGGYQIESAFPENLEGVNAYFLYQPIIEKKKRYVRDFIQTLKSQGAPLEAVLAWDLENEAHFMETQKPLSLSSGKIRAANGRLYDMGRSADRNDMIREGLVYWADQVAAEVKDVDPEGLTSVSFFSPAAVGGKDPRITLPSQIILDPEEGGSSIDLVDIHLYPGSIPIEKELESFGIAHTRKPLLLGEMGIEYYPRGPVKSVAVALRKLQSLQRASCKFGVKGWLLYSWDTVETKNGKRDFFTGYDDDWELANGLSPSRLSTPCGSTVAQRN